jgi:hypothetical protein
MAGIRASLIVVTATAIALFLGGCLFSPREPDGPPTGGATDWQTPVNTTVVLENLAAALVSEGTSNYTDCFTEDYRFHVDPQDSLDAGQEADDRYANWTLEDEEQSAGSIFADAFSIAVKFENYTPPEEQYDVTYREEDYTLTIGWEAGPNAGKELVYKGRATLWMRNDAGRWAILRWADARTVDPDENETWGVLRGDYRG